MKATLYEWQGSPDRGSKHAIGEVRIENGRAVWDRNLDPLFDIMPYSSHLGHVLDPANGREFVEDLPFVFRAAPYLWAETSG